MTLILIHIKFLHTHIKKNFIKLYVYTYIYLYIVLLSIFFVRYNIINSLHNFLLNNNLIQYNNYIYIYVIIIIVFILKALIANFFKKNLTQVFYTIVYNTIYIYAMIYLCNFIIFKNFLIFVLVMLFNFYIIIFLNKIFLKHFFKIFFFSNFINFLDFLQIFLILNMTIVKKNIKSYIIHICLLFIYIYSMHQIHIFTRSTVDINNIQFIKINYFTIVDNYYDTFFVKSNIFILHNYINEINIIFQNFFEKIFFYNNVCVGIYNYNFYQTYQIYVNVFLLLFLIMFFKIKIFKINNINKFIKI